MGTATKIKAQPPKTPPPLEKLSPSIQKKLIERSTVAKASAVAVQPTTNTPVGGDVMKPRPPAMPPPQHLLKGTPNGNEQGLAETEAKADIFFQDVEGDEIHVKFENGLIVLYQNGKLAVSGMFDLKIDEQTRTLRFEFQRGNESSIGSVTFGANADMHEIACLRDKLLKKAEAAADVMEMRGLMDKAVTDGAWETATSLQKRIEEIE